MSRVLCQLADLPEGAARGFDLQGKGVDKVFVVRKGNDVFAYLDSCPHYQSETSLPWRKDAYLNPSGEAIVCAAHGAKFDIETGECVSGVCLGQSLTKVPLQVSHLGQLLID